MSDLEVPDGMGVIVRTAGSERSKPEIKRDFEYLLRLWDEIRELTLQSTAPALIYEEGNLIKRSIRDLYARDIEEVVVDGEEGYKTAKDFMRMLMPSHAKRVKPYRDPSVPLFHRYQVEAQIDAIHSPVVQLRSGGYIVINPTEALVAIDVNSGRSTARAQHRGDGAQDQSRGGRGNRAAVAPARSRRPHRHRLHRHGGAPQQRGRSSAASRKRCGTTARASSSAASARSGCWNCRASACARRWSKPRPALPALQRHRPYPLDRIGGAPRPARDRGRRHAPPLGRDRGRRAAQGRALYPQPEARGAATDRGALRLPCHRRQRRDAGAARLPPRPRARADAGRDRGAAVALPPPPEPEEDEDIVAEDEEPSAPAAAAPARHADRTHHRRRGARGARGARGSGAAARRPRGSRRPRGTRRTRPAPPPPPPRAPRRAPPVRRAAPAPSAGRRRPRRHRSPKLRRRPKRTKRRPADTTGPRRARDAMDAMDAAAVAGAADGAAGATGKRVRAKAPRSTRARTTNSATRNRARTSGPRPRRSSWCRPSGSMTRRQATSPRPLPRRRCRPHTSSIRAACRWPTAIPSPRPSALRKMRSARPAYNVPPPKEVHRPAAQSAPRLVAALECDPDRSRHLSVAPATRRPGELHVTCPGFPLARERRYVARSASSYRRHSLRRRAASAIVA